MRAPAAVLTACILSSFLLFEGLLVGGTAIQAPSEECGRRGWAYSRSVDMRVADSDSWCMHVSLFSWLVAPLPPIVSGYIGLCAACSLIPKSVWVVGTFRLVSSAGVCKQDRPCCPAAFSSVLIRARQDLF